MKQDHRIFELRECVGRGGFGEVYRAIVTPQSGVSSEVALKLLRQDVAMQSEAVQRIRDEAEWLTHLHHPTILTVYDLTVLNERITLVTEFVDGVDLTECLQPAGELEGRALLEVLAQVAGALDVAWTSPHPTLGVPLRMVHRDIKPSNIRITKHGDVKLLDFGIARTDGIERSAHTKTGMLIGSPPYMAPERFLDREVRIQSDVFSLASILYEGLTGELFYGDLSVPMLLGYALSEERYQALLDAQLLEVLAAPEMIAFLRDGLAFDPLSRPDPVGFMRTAEQLVQTAAGPSLRRYCRTRSWGSADPVFGELTGTTLRPTAELPWHPPAPPSAPPPTPVDEPITRHGLWFALVGTSGSVVLVLSFAFGLIVVVALLTFRQQGVSAPIVPTPATSPTPQAVAVSPPPAVALPPSPTPPASATPPPAPKMRPTPDVKASEPVAEPPAQRTTGRVEVKGKVVVYASKYGERTVLPADLAPGTYELFGRFDGLHEVPAGTVKVYQGETSRLSCSARLSRCIQRK